MARQLEILVKLRDVVSRPLAQIRNTIRGLGSAIVAPFRLATSAIFNMRTALVAAGAAFAAFRASRVFVDAASSIETYRTQLIALEGDTAKAEAALASIRAFAASSPLDTSEVVESFVQLRAIGVEAADDIVKALGNIALIFPRLGLEGVTQSFVSFEAESLRKLGIEMERVASKNLAILRSGDIKVETENTAEAIREGLIDVWTQRFPNAMELAGNTYRAKMAVFRSTLFELSADIGELFLPSVKRALDGITKLLNDNRDTIVASIRLIPEAVSSVFGQIRTAISAVFAASRGTVSQFGAGVITALAGLASAIGGVLSTLLEGIGRVLITGLGSAFRLVPPLVTAAGEAIVFALAQLGIKAAEVIGPPLIGAAFRVKRTFEVAFSQLFEEIAPALNKAIEVINFGLRKLGREPIELFKVDKTSLDAELNKIDDEVRQFQEDFAAEQRALGEQLLGSLNLADNFEPALDDIKFAWIGLLSEFADGSDELRDNLSEVKAALLDVADASGVTAVIEELEAKLASLEAQIAATRAAAVSAGGGGDELGVQPPDINQFRAGLAEAIDAVRVADDEIRKLTESMGSSIKTNFVDSFASGVKAVREGTQSVGGAFKSMAVSVLESLEQIIAKMIALQLFEKTVQPIAEKVFGAFGAKSEDDQKAGPVAGAAAVTKTLISEHLTGMQAVFDRFISQLPGVLPAPAVAGGGTGSPDIPSIPSVSAPDSPAASLEVDGPEATDFSTKFLDFFKNIFGDLFGQLSGLLNRLFSSLLGGGGFNLGKFLGDAIGGAVAGGIGGGGGALNDDGGVVDPYTKQTITRPVGEQLLSNFRSNEDLVGGLRARSFASGGIVSGPSLIMAGDNASRREAVVPLPGGRAIPVDLRGGEGASMGVVNNNFTIQAIDTSSFEQLLIRRRPLIEGMVLDGIERSPSFRRRIRGR